MFAGGIIVGNVLSTIRMVRWWNNAFPHASVPDQVSIKVPQGPVIPGAIEEVIAPEIRHGAL